MNKLIITLLFAASFLTVNAQDNGVPVFMTKIKQALDPSAVAELHTFDAQEIAGVIKVRRAARRTGLTALIDTYNDDVRSLKIDNLSSMAGLGTRLKDIFVEKEYAGILTARADYKQEVEAVIAKKDESFAQLETELDEYLTRRQQRKWNKFLESRRQEIEKQFDIADLLDYIGF